MSVLMIRPHLISLSAVRSEVRYFISILFTLNWDICRPPV